MNYMMTNSAKLLVFSFLIVILLGSLLLTFPTATTDGKGASALTAIFTSTSATCVTGLIVADTPNYFTQFGQIVILTLIQIGGLGIMTLSVSLALILGKSLGIREKSAMQNILDSEKPVSVNRILIFILKSTFLIELIGAFILTARFYSIGLPFNEALFKGVFHSISAFCNAGFALYSDSFVGFSEDFVLNATLVILIILGGLGFTVIASVFNRRNYKLLKTQKKKITIFRRMSVHTKIVLITTLTLILTGTIFIYFFEFENMLVSDNILKKVLSSFFQSVTLRTAGFNTIDIGNLKEITLFFMIIFMFIGAGSGSTAGGIKITTFVTFLLSVKAMIFGRKEIEVFNRHIPQSTVYKSIAIIVISLTILMFLFSILLYTQDFSFLNLLFEAVSAFGTVGLSTGITPALTKFGKIIIILLMFAGRIGPLTLALSINEKRKESNISFPSAKIIVG